MNQATKETVVEKVAAELSQITDAQVLASIRALLVTPRLQHREWDYGAAGEAYPCWIVLEHPASRTGIAYSEYGFGPQNPWGLVWLDNDGIGMDCCWYSTLEYAFRESMALDDG